MNIVVLIIRLCNEDDRLSNITIDLDNFSVSIGNTYLIRRESLSVLGNEFCATIVDIRPPRPGDQVNATIITDYGFDGCQECFSENSNYLLFKSCFFGQFNEIVVDKTQWTGLLPTIDNIYFLDFYVGSLAGGSVLFQGCFRFDRFVVDQPGFNQVVFLTGNEEKDDCETCLSDSPIIYRVIECTSNDPYYISFPSNTFDGHLITFTDSVGLTQYCGIVDRLLSGVTITGFLISDLGNPRNTGLTCEDCLSNVSGKRIIGGCLDSENTEVVWASTLFSVGDSTHLSSGDGCYEVGDETASAVTLNELANYAPQENCEDCLECYGLEYDFVTCDEIETCGAQNPIFFNTSSGSRESVIDSGNNMFITLQGTGTIFKYDLTTQTPIGSAGLSVLSGPFGIDLDETNGVICVSNQFANSVRFFDYNDLSNSSIFSGGTPSNGRKVYFEPNDGLFYVLFDTFGMLQNIQVYSASSYNLVTQVGSFGSTNGGYRDIVRVGSVLYVLNTNNQTIELYNSTTYTPINTYSLGVQPSSFDYNVPTNTLYISTQNTSSYLKYNVVSNTFTVVPFTRDCIIGGDLVKIKLNILNDRIYITDYNCNRIYEFELSTDTLLNTYSDNLNNPFGIGNDISGNTWFGDVNKIFQLGCETGIVSGTTTSNELVDVGQTFFNPFLNVCCVVTDRRSLTEDSFLAFTEYFSMLNFDNCESCDSGNVESFICQVCDFDFGFAAVLVAPTGTYNIGDIVRSEYGNSNFLCFEIFDYYDVNNYGTGYPVFESTGSPYPTCDECTNNSFVGITVINTSTLQSSKVKITLSDWLTIFGFLTGIPFTSVKGADGFCYQIVNLCPLDEPEGPIFEITDFYINQFFCENPPPPLPPVSAGTEYLVCNICEGPSGFTATTIVPPHPVWTRPNGQQVTLLDTVALGGMFGLNN